MSYAGNVKLLLDHLRARCADKAFTITTDEQLATDTCMGKSTVARILAILVVTGALEVTRQKRLPSIYRLASHHTKVRVKRRVESSTSEAVESSTWRLNSLFPTESLTSSTESSKKERKIQVEANASTTRRAAAPNGKKSLQRRTEKASRPKDPWRDECARRILEANVGFTTHGCHAVITEMLTRADGDRDIVEFAIGRLEAVRPTASTWGFLLGSVRSQKEKAAKPAFVWDWAHS